MRILVALAVTLGLGACVAPARYPTPDPEAPNAGAAPVVPVSVAAENFVAVVDRVEPVAEAYCRSLRRVANCDFQIVVDDRPGQPANAFQTLDNTGRPILAMTVALIADARNRDELAFVMGHEAAHHIAGHIPQQQNTALAGAVLAGILAQAGGAGEQGIRAAQDMGATVGARRYSKDFELEADSLGSEIAHAAGFNPLIGMAFFDRLPDPGDAFLGSHPANAQRKAVVQDTVARLNG